MISHTYKKFAVLSLLICTLLPSAYVQGDPAQVAEPAPEQKLQTRVENLATIQQSIEARQLQLRQLRQKLKKPDDASEKQDIEQKNCVETALTESSKTEEKTEKVRDCLTNALNNYKEARNFYIGHLKEANNAKCYNEFLSKTSRKQ